MNADVKYDEVDGQTVRVTCAPDYRQVDKVLYDDNGIISDYEMIERIER